jgi:hypothetical protein
MGEIADMMLDGTLCETCGEFIDEADTGGFPRKCAACLADENPQDDRSRVKNAKKKKGGRR